MTLSPLDIGIFLVYFAVVIALGYYATRKSVGTKRDYFLAGDKLPWWMIGGSIVASNLSTHQFVGLTGAAYDRGFVAITAEWGAILLGLNVLLWIFLPFYLRNGFYTMPEFLQRRFGGAARVGYAGLILLIYVFVEISAVLYLGAFTLHFLLGINMLPSIVVLAFLTCVDTIAGGLRAVVADTQITFPERPSAADPRRTVKVDAEDCVMIPARMANGALGNIEATKIATGAEDEVRFEIHGEKGALRFNSMDPHFLEAFDAGVAGSPIGGMQGWTRIATGQRFPAPASAFPGPKFSLGWIRVHAACLANFLQAVELGQKGNPGIDHGIYIQYLMGRIRHSQRSRSWTECCGKESTRSSSATA